MMINVHTLQVDGLRRKQMSVLITLCVVAIITGRVSRLIHANVPQDGRVQIVVPQFVSNPVFTMAIAPTQIFAREHFIAKTVLISLRVIDTDIEFNLLMTDVNEDGPVLIAQ